MKSKRGAAFAQPDFEFESQLWREGIRIIAGVDEAGRGALAGPVSAGILVLPADLHLLVVFNGMYDSKKLTPVERERFAEKIVRVAVGYAVGFAAAREIDQLGILPATRLAAQRALASLEIVPQYLLVDYIALPECPIAQTGIIRGDERSLSIAGASILAKVSRDEMMRSLDVTYPGYNFAAHKGYGTLAHRHALARLGPCPEHRLSFKYRLP